jgi:SAM-dependent methyltransferase
MILCFKEEGPMDQLSFYELQVHPSGVQVKDGYINKGRDEFVVNYINRSNSFVHEGSLRVAELSIGDGSLSRSILHSNNAIELTCADISPSRIRTAADLLVGSGLIDRATFVECNFDTQFDLLPEDSFDVVVALDVMEHVFDVFNFVANCFRILKAGGTLILRVPNIAYIKHRLRLLMGGLPITASWFGRPGVLTEWRTTWGWDGGHLHLFTIPILYRLLYDYNFDVLLCRDPGTRFESFRNLRPNLMYSNPVLVAKKRHLYAG